MEITKPASVPIRLIEYPELVFDTVRVPTDIAGWRAELFRDYAFKDGTLKTAEHTNMVVPRRLSSAQGPQTFHAVSVRIVDPHCANHHGYAPLYGQLRLFFARNARVIVDTTVGDVDGFDHANCLIRLPSPYGHHFALNDDLQGALIWKSKHDLPDALTVRVGLHGAPRELGS